MTANVPEKGDLYKPNGKVQGDDHPIPNAGTGTGVTDTYGADLGQNADNREGSIRHATRSDGKDFA